VSAARSDHGRPPGDPIYLSAAIATLLVTIGFVPALRRALLRHASG
jgi:hypothetical protein